MDKQITTFTKLNTTQQKEKKKKKNSGMCNYMEESQKCYWKKPLHLYEVQG